MAGGHCCCIHIIVLCSSLVVGITCEFIGLAQDQSSPLVVLNVLIYSPHCFVTKSRQGAYIGPSNRIVRTLFHALA